MSPDASTTQRRLDRLTALAEIDLGMEGSLDDALQRIVDITTTLLPTTGGASVVLWDADDGVFTNAATTVPGQQARVPLTHIRTEGGVTRRIVDQGAAVYLEQADRPADGISPSDLIERAGVASFAGVPISADGQNLGVLYALDIEERPYPPEDRRFLEVLAKRAASAILNARLVEETRAAGDRSEALAWVANALIGAGDLPDVLQAVVEGVAASLSVDRVSLVTIDSELQVVVDQVHGGLALGEVEDITYLDLVSGLEGWVLRERRVAATSGTNRHAQETEDSHRARIALGVGPTVVAPLAGSEGRVGTMSVMRATTAPDFTEQEINLVLAMANQATVGIDNVRLIESTRSSLKETETLYSFSQELAAADGLPEVLDKVVAGSREAVVADAVALFLTDADSREPVVSGSLPDDVSLAELWSGPVAEALAGRRGIRPAPIGDVSLLVVPLLAHQRIAGAVVAVNAPGSADFTGHHLELLTALSSHAASAIDSVRLFEEVQRLAITDDLTGIHNRRHLFDLGEHEFRQAVRYHRPMAAILFDLDRFKDVNDTYGHGIGDEVLVAVAEQCLQLIRDVDVLGRYGGEEFAVLLPETDLKAALEIAERFRAAVAATPLETSAGPITVTVSAGVAEIHEDMIDVHSLIDRADAAMYFAKRTGRNRVEGG